MEPSKAAKISIKRLSKLVCYSRDVLMIFDGSGKNVFVSPSVRDVLGYDPKELIGSTGWKFVHPDDVPLLRKAFERLQKKQGCVLSEKHRVRHKNGSWVHLESNAINLLQDPGIIGYVLHSRDITQFLRATETQQMTLASLRESEKKFQELFNSNADGIVRIDMQGELQEANPSFIRMLGYERFKDIPSPFEQITPERWHDIETKIIREQVIVRGYSDEYEKEFIRSDGNIIPVSIKVYLIKEKGKPVGMWGIAHDNTRQKRTERRLALAVNKLESMNRHKMEAREEERKAIASIIHDEVGQSMTAVNLDLGWLSENIEDRKACLKRIERMQEIIDSTIKAMQRLSGELRPGILDDLGLRPAIEWYCRHFKERTGICCNLKLSDCFISKKAELPLFRIVQEALTNVCRHARATKVDLELSYSKDAIRLIIADNGVGIPLEKIHHIQSFGLMGMRERAEMCGGELFVSANSGTCIIVLIPFSD